MKVLTLIEWLLLYYSASVTLIVFSMCLIKLIF